MKQTKGATSNPNDGAHCLLICKIFCSYLYPQVIPVLFKEPSGLFFSQNALPHLKSASLFITSTAFCIFKRGSKGCCGLAEQTQTPLRWVEFEAVAKAAIYRKALPFPTESFATATKSSQSALQDDLSELRRNRQKQDIW